MYGRRTTGRATVATQDQVASPTMTMRRTRTNLSDLLVPEHKVGKAPDRIQELRTILSGSRASLLPYLFLRPGVLTWPTSV